MRITGFTIKKFKSIENLSIPVETYGKGKNKSSVAFLVGLNESGKSSIMEAINLWYEELDKIDYDEYFHKGSDEGAYIWIEANIDLEDEDYYSEQISELLKIDIEYAEKIKFSQVKNITYRDAKVASNFFSISIRPDFPFHEFVYSKTTGIQNLRELNEIEEKITVKNAKSFLLDGQVLLTKKDIEEQIRLKLDTILTNELPAVKSWKPQPEYLINEVIDLNAFMIDTDISIPLRNIFFINGIDTNEKIKATIEKALKKPEKKAELQANLSKSITSYINKIWKELKINIKINIDGSNCSVHVEDKDKEHNFFSMSQRSDGFNQFVSLILSLSTENTHSEITNNIILLDEPEIHLHPSGVRYMRDEILKIGKKNFLFVATHSHYMIDTTTPERHFIVSKDQMKTHIQQINENTSMNDDQVLASAFGLKLFKELLPQNILVVEGGDDKSIISHALDILFQDFFYSIKSAGGASKVYSIASILADEKIPAFFILDDDKDGRDAKNSILANYKDSHSREHVLTIKDISPAIPEKSTLEDLLPKSFVKKFFETEMEHTFTFDDNLPVILQIKNQDESLKTNKDQLTAKKIKLAEKFIDTYKTKSKLESDVPDLVKLIEGIVKKIRK